MGDPAEIEELRRAIRHLHGCDSRWIESVAVREEFQGKVVWDGEVEVFELLGHPGASKAYAWSHEMLGTTRRKYVAVLHESPVDSPREAVRAAIVSELRKRLS
jgi:hypothetical protein